eukprot:scaffold1554_cov332-Pavlova_lutheri.AAC.2
MEESTVRDTFPSTLTEPREFLLVEGWGSRSVTGWDGCGGDNRATWRRWTRRRRTRRARCDAIGEGRGTTEGRERGTGTNG